MRETRELLNRFWGFVFKIVLGKNELAYYENKYNRANKLESMFNLEASRILMEHAATPIDRR